MSWTKAVTMKGPEKFGNGQYLYKFVLTCTSDASSSGDITLSTELTTTYGSQQSTYFMQKIKGGVLYQVEYVPDGTSTPTAAAVITIDNENGTLLFSETVDTVGTAQMWSGAIDTGFSVSLSDLIFASTTLANNKIAVFNIWILK